MRWLSRSALVRVEKEPKAATPEDDRHYAPLPAQDRPGRDVEFGGFDLGAVAEAHARHLDEPALGVDAQPFGAGRDDLAELLAAHRAKSRRHDLFRVEQIELFVALILLEDRP